MRPQAEGDLGARLSSSFDDAFASGARKVVIIGSDCPDVTQSEIQEAFEALDRVPLVIGPASDGGYWLIGLRQPAPGLFRDIHWSSDEVFLQTASRAKDLGLKWEMLQILQDIDTFEDWQHYNNGR